MQIRTSLTHFRSSALLATALGTSLLTGPLVSQAHARQGTEPKIIKSDAPADAKALSEYLPDQAHAMADVGYQFANLWFAADQQNWQLASYYLTVTRQHLSRAVQINPVQKASDGKTVDLKSIVEEVDHRSLADVGKAIAEKDSAKFKAAYRQTIEACNSRLAGYENPFLHLQVPNAPGASVLNSESSSAGTR